MGLSHPTFNGIFLSFLVPFSFVLFDVYSHYIFGRQQNKYNLIILVLYRRRRQEDHDRRDQERNLEQREANRMEEQRERIRQEDRQVMMQALAACVSAVTNHFLPRTPTP